MRIVLSITLALFLCVVNITALEGSCGAFSSPKSKKSDFLSNYNTFPDILPVTTEIPPGSSIPFNGTPVRSGKVSQPSLDTFKITKSGKYYINVVVDALFPTFDSNINLELNGELIPPVTSVHYGETPLIIQQIFHIKASKHKPALLRVIAVGINNLHFTGPAAQISIIGIE